jgi:kynureninase
LRLAPGPLYTSFAECSKAVDILEEILATKTHDHLPDRDARVT